MPTTMRCPSCGRLLKISADTFGRQVECPYCGRPIVIANAPRAEATPPTVESHSEAHEQPTATAEAAFYQNYVEPPSSHAAPSAESTTLKSGPWQRMFEALIDPRSIQWMLMIGGALCVLGLVVWLTSLGVFKNPHVLAAALGFGTLSIIAAGWFVTLRTRFHIAGQAITFLGCVVAPLNLWFYHAQNLVTVDGHLWVGGVVCCVLYAVTVVMLRDAAFMYAFEAGVTLTTLLLLGDLGKITDTTWLSLFFMALGQISIHCERMFSPAEESEFPRRRFGLPLFWSGHAQVAASLLILLGSQLLGWMEEPARALFGSHWIGELLITNYLLAAGVWLAGMYAYVYSDVVVRKIGVYLALAGVCAVMAQVTLLLGFDVRAEWILAAMALTSVAINVGRREWPGIYMGVDRFVPSLSLVLSAIPAAWGIVLHLRATTVAAHELGWAYSTGWQFVAVMFIVAVANCVNAVLCQHTDRKSSSAHYFVSAASMLVGAAALLRVVGVPLWIDQAPWLMLIPIGYLVASQARRGCNEELPLYWVAQIANTVLLVHVCGALLQDPHNILPTIGSHPSILSGIVFFEAAGFYLLAGLFRRNSINIYLAAATSCVALWQFLGYFGVNERYYTVLYASLGIVCLCVSRAIGLKKDSQTNQSPDEKHAAASGGGFVLFQCGNGILTIACLAALMQGLAGLAVRSGDWWDILTILLTIVIALLAAVIVPTTDWRRIYTADAFALGAVMLLRMNLLIQLSGWQKMELFCVAAGTCMLVASHIGLFREENGGRNESVGLGLGLGAILVIVPLLIAVFYHRWISGQPSIYDEMALLTFSIPMLVTGLSWKIKATTLWGGPALSFYLLVLGISLIHRPQVAIGVYMAAGGAVVFAIGIVLSVYREKLLSIPDQVANRQGVFKILNWR